MRCIRRTQLLDVGYSSTGSMENISDLRGCPDKTDQYHKLMLQDLYGVLTRVTNAMSLAPLGIITQCIFLLVVLRGCEIHEVVTWGLFRFLLPERSGRREVSQCAEKS